jgi:DNA-binding NtrC family response regulator
MDALAHVLVVDDDRSIRRSLEKFLQDEGHEVVTAGDGAEGLELIRGGGSDVVLLDLGLPGMDGMEVLEVARTLDHPPPVVVITARDDMRSTVRAIQLGAYDYLVKPLDVQRLKITVQRALESRERTRTLRQLVEQAQVDFQVDNIIGKSAAIREIYKMIGAVSTSHTSVLISGESGTGKELVARAVHYSSEDRDKPFVAVNCTAFPRDLLESELFGHVRGAFTGAVADKVGRFQLAGAGTLFLDEIGELPWDLQAKLLRVLQERVFERVGDTRPLPLKARILAATHRDLAAMVKEGTFREDLFYRLKIVEIHIPPLRERKEDIPALVEGLLAKTNRELHKDVRYLSQEAMDVLLRYPWPGNVRELENTLTRAVVLAKGDVIDASLLPLDADDPPAVGDTAPEPPAPGDGEILSLRQIEKAHIARALRHTGWNKRRTCGLLQITRPTLDRKIKEFGLERDPS